MRGILRVIPSATSRRSQRLMLLRKAPSPFMIEASVGGAPQLIETFDSILEQGEILPCRAYRCAEPGRENQPNVFANLLWLQALIRADGFNRVYDQPQNLSGSVALLFGDSLFMEALPLAFALS